MTKPNYLRALEAAWDEMKVWVKDGRFIPENEESIQCFLYHGIVNHLGTAFGVRSKPMTTHTKSRSDRNKQSDTKGTHFPDFILGDPKEVAIEIKFARANASILGSCKQDVAKLKKYHSAPGVSKVFILFDVNPDFAFFNELQREALQEVDSDCRLMHYPDTLSTKTSNDAGIRAQETKKRNAELAKERRSNSAKKSWATRNEKKATAAAKSK